MNNMRIGKIAPSVMCVDFMKLGETLKLFEENQIEYIHVDIMDGEFVPKYKYPSGYSSDD